MRRGIGALGAVASVLVLSGCGAFPFGFACSAIGYSSVAVITLADPRPGLTLEVCAGEGCTPGATDDVLEPEGDSVTGWRAVFFNSAAVLGYRLTAADGTVVADSEIDPEWRRIDGTERCGGNHEAQVELPA